MPEVRHLCFPEDAIVCSCHKAATWNPESSAHSLAHALVVDHDVDLVVLGHANSAVFEVVANHLGEGFHGFDGAGGVGCHGVVVVVNHSPGRLGTILLLARALLDNANSIRASVGTAWEEVTRGPVLGRLLLGNLLGHIRVLRASDVELIDLKARLLGPTAGGDVTCRLHRDLVGSLQVPCLTGDVYVLPQILSLLSRYTLYLRCDLVVVSLQVERLSRGVPSCLQGYAVRFDDRGVCLGLLLFSRRVVVHPC